MFLYLHILLIHATETGYADVTGYMFWFPSVAADAPVTTRAAGGGMVEGDTVWPGSHSTIILTLFLSPFTFFTAGQRDSVTRGATWALQRQPGSVNINIYMTRDILLGDRGAKYV